MSYPKKYIHLSRASDLFGTDRVLYRTLEILPAVLAWGTIFGMIFLSWARPIWVSIFIIIFDLYWFVKTIFLSFHLRSSWRRMAHHLEMDWYLRLETLKWDHVWQLVLLPTAAESLEVIEESLASLSGAEWPKWRMIVVLSLEDRSPEVRVLGASLEKRHRDDFGSFLVTYHPYGLEGELQGKGSNETWAIREAKRLIDEKKIPYENIIVSSFDIDSKLFGQFFLCLTWHFLTAERPYRSSFQPVPLYHNNIWDAGVVSRVVASSGTFWQMMQQERPERLTTFSSHSMSFKSLVEIDFWQVNIVSEDSRIFWNHFLYYDGDWRVVPLFYPISMDANLAHSTWQTLKNVYKQQRRWGWGVENIPYVLFGFIKNAHVSSGKKIRFTVNLLEGFWSWSTNALLIFALGWLPVFLGGRAFNMLSISYNLPRVTRTIMIFAMFGIVTSAIISQAILRKTKDDFKSKRHPSLLLQWLLMPLTIIIFGALPALEAQTRLALGGKLRLGFWVTPKSRKISAEVMRSSIK